MPAVSQKQQRFMGMVHADQEGELDHPSAAVDKAAHSMSHKSAEDFASTSHKGLPEGGNVLEAIAKYSQYGKALRHTSTMREIAEQLSQIAELAEQQAISEADDWYDEHTLKRHMKEMKSYSGDFAKYAEEADMLHQRMEALYEDMGRVLERYFELETGSEDPELMVKKVKDDNDSELDSSPRFSDEDNTEIDEGTEVEAGTSKDTVPMESPNRGRMNVRDDDIRDVNDNELTLRAIKTVHENLVKNGQHDLAKRFRGLGAKKMKECVWKMVR
jgi:hypothetical protein